MKIDLKRVLLENANYQHPDFGTVAAFLSGLGDKGIIEYKAGLAAQDK